MCDALVGVLKTASDRREKEEKRPPGSSSSSFPIPALQPPLHKLNQSLSLSPFPPDFSSLRHPPKKGLFPFSFVGGERGRSGGGGGGHRPGKLPNVPNGPNCPFFQPSLCHAPNSHTLIPRREKEKAVFFFSLATLPKVSLAGLLPTSRTSYVAYETIGRTFLLPAQNSTVHVSHKAKWVNSWM